MKFIIKHLSKSYENDLVLKDIDFTFESGKIYGLLGRNGAGKTTLFNCINRDIKRDSGELSMEVDGVERPLTPEDIGYVLSARPKKVEGDIVIRTFGNFDVYVKGEPVRFKSAKGKELLAYLVDRRGGNVTRAEAFSVLWEDRDYDRGMQKSFDVVIRRLRETLREYKIEKIFEMKQGTMRVCPEHFTCDAYLFYDGDVDVINTYPGEYMSAYSWASMTESFLTWKLTGER